MSKLSEILEELLGEPFSAVSAVGHFRELERWDSLQYLNLVVSLQQEFSTEFSPEEIEGLTSVAGIEAVLTGKGVQL